MNKRFKLAVGAVALAASACTPGTIPNSPIGLPGGEPEAKASSVPMPEWGDGTFAGCLTLFSSDSCDQLWEHKMNGADVYEDGSWITFNHLGNPVLSGCVPGTFCQGAIMNRWHELPDGTFVKVPYECDELGGC